MAHRMIGRTGPMRPQPARVIRRTHLTRLLTCCVLGYLIGAWSGDARSEPVLTKAISPQPVADALAAFAHQTGLQLVYVSEIVRSRMSKGAPAGLAPAEALARLLDGTGLGFEFLNARTIRIFVSVAVKPSAQSSTSEVPKRPIDRHSAPITALRDVLVTAFRSTDPLGTNYDGQSFPPFVSVVSGDRLEAQKLEQLTDYAASVPGLIVAGGGSPGQATVILRGISPEAEASTVGFYLDDAPMGPIGSHGSPWGFPLDLMPYDLERLEVLRGPQVTRYGAGSEGGLIRYVLNAPGVNDFEARIGADLSMISGAGKPGASMRAVVNAPLIAGALGVRVSAYDSYAPGYIDNAYTGARDVNALRQYGGRIAALWLPAPSLSVKVSGLWHRIESDSNTVESFGGIYTLPNTGAAYIIGASTSFGDLTENHAFESPFGKNINYYSATVHWNPGSFEFNSATAWSQTVTHQARDDTQTVGTNYPYFSNGTIAASLARFQRNLTLEKFSEELRMSSTKGRRVEWMLGGFYTQEVATDRQADYAFDNAYHPVAAYAPALTTLSLPSTFKEWAIFGELTWRVTERFELSAGARYAHDDEDGLAIYGGTTVAPVTAVRQRSDTATPWTVTARYYFAPEVSLYGRVATAYKPSISNAGISGVPPTAPAEALINYEAGLKSEFFDRKASVDVSVYYISWKDLQIEIYNPNLNTIDGGNAATKGVELTASYSPRPGLKLACNSAFTQSGFTTPAYQSGITPASTGQYFLPGYQLSNVPKWSIALSADYEAPVTPAWRARVGGAFHWVDKVWGPPVANVALGGPTYELPSYSVLDVNAGITNGRLALKTFARNLANKRGYRGGSEILNTASFIWEQIDYYLVQPRTVGIGFDYAF
jgi:iron complex outermembrane receptor protein